MTRPRRADRELTVLAPATGSILNSRSSAALAAGSAHHPRPRQCLLRHPPSRRRPRCHCTEARGIPCRPVLEGLSSPFVLVGHSYSGVPVTEVAAAREDVTHVVYVCAFTMPAGTSMLDVLGGQPPEWWIFAEDGESIMPDNPGALGSRAAARGRRGSRTRAGHDHFPGLRPPPHAQPPRRASSHLGWDRRANRPHRTGHVLIRRFLTARAGVDARGQARYGADLQGVGDSWSGTG